MNPYPRNQQNQISEPSSVPLPPQSLSDSIGGLIEILTKQTQEMEQQLGELYSRCEPLLPPSGGTPVPDNKTSTGTKPSRARQVEQLDNISYKLGTLTNGINFLKHNLAI